MSLFSKLSQVFGSGQKAQPKLEKPVVQVQTPATPTQKAKVQQPEAKKGRGVRLQSRPIKAEQPQVPVVDETSIREAQAKAREIVLEAKSEALKIREDAEDRARKFQEQYNKLQNELNLKTNQLDRKEAALEEKERYITKLDTEVAISRQEVEKLKKRLIEKLEEISTLTRDEAKKQILDAVKNKSTKDIALIIKQAEEQAQEEADDKARDILIDAMKHGATDYVAEYTVSTVEIPSEDIKGRLIGKEGRNIRAFEKATGVDLDLDESPGAIRLSSFDSVRREVAKVALKRLIRDGRIQPTRIEEYVQQARDDINRVMLEEGKKLCHAVGAFNVPRDLMLYLGHFKYRSSYGQNMIAHTLEETKIGIALAHEVGANVDTVRLGCLFHDIGKIVTDDEGSHVELGVKLLKKYQMQQAVIDAVAQHHEDEPFSSNESVLVYIADAISGARPGARMENYEEYIKRLGSLEAIAKENKGVVEAYAIQAGREIRVLVNHKELKDEDCVVLADSIRDRIKNELTYPGTVTVNVIREVRAQAVAK